MEIVQIASALFSAGSLMKNAFRKWRSGKDRDEPRAAGDTNVDVTLDLGLECESPEAAIIAVGSELAMKASRAFFPSRTQRRNQAITGLSTEFAAYRIQVRYSSWRSAFQLASTCMMICLPQHQWAAVLVILKPRTNSQPPTQSSSREVPSGLTKRRLRLLSSAFLGIGCIK